MLCNPYAIFLFVVVFSNVCSRLLTLQNLHTVQLPIFDPFKLCDAITKRGIEILPEKFTTEANQTFSLQNGMCLNKGSFFWWTKYLHSTFEPQTKPEKNHEKPVMREIKIWKLGVMFRYLNRYICDFNK